MLRAVKILNKSTIQVTDWWTRREDFNTVWQNPNMRSEDGITVFNGNEEDCQKYVDELRHNTDATVEVLDTGEEKTYSVVAYNMQIEKVELNS